MMRRAEQGNSGFLGVGLRIGRGVVGWKIRTRQRSEEASPAYIDAEAMKITLYSAASPTELGDDVSPAELSRFDGITLEKDLSDHMDDDMLDLGIGGGDARLLWLPQSGLTVAVDFWAPRRLSEDEVRKLREYVSGQLEDGFGESGFDVESDNRRIHLTADVDSPIAVEQSDDGRVIPTPSPVALAARDGDMAWLQAAVADGADIDGRLGGYTGLQLSILHARVSEAIWLIERGANVRLLAPSNDSCLHLCAVARELDDESSAEIARQLLSHGADPGPLDQAGQTAAKLARSRGKMTLAELLAHAS